MKYVIRLANILLDLISERPLKVEKEWEVFLESTEEKADLTVKISWDWKSAMRPTTEVLSKNTIQSYYYENDHWFCVLEEGWKEPVASVSYLENLEEMVCTINKEPFISAPDSIGRIVRALPIREILLQFSTVIFHAAQISYAGVGILFSAPSGTGKTTQVNLWKKYKNAMVVCNDRTLVRKHEDGYRTYGFPLDGSEPVCSDRVSKLGAIIILQQGKKNVIQSLAPMHAVSRLMEQTVIDSWNAASREKVLLFLLEMVEKIPIYVFSCTPDQEAVEVLWNYLLQEEVIEVGKSYG